MARTQHSDFERLLRSVRRCTICAEHLDPRPVVRAHPDARILIVGQAPGRRVHETGIPWNDPSGERLRDWLGVDKEQFYDERIFALVPMGFCFPGTGKGGDLPPRPECAPEWHPQLLQGMPGIRLTLLLSRYALDRYLGDESKKTVSETVAAWKTWQRRRPPLVPMPHPSPRNNRWLRNHPWFEEEVVPWLRRKVRRLVAD